MLANVVLSQLEDHEAILKQGVSDTAELIIKYRIQKKSVFSGVIEDLRRRVKLLSAQETPNAS